MDPRQRITDGYAGTDTPDRPRRGQADAYRPSPYYEQLLRLKREEPATWRSLPPALHIEVGLYAEQKQAYEAQQEAQT